jgi:hypothetical protein
MIMIPSLFRINLATFTHDYIGRWIQMIMILSLCRINLATFTHDYKRVVGVDSAGQERDSSACVICLSGKALLESLDPQDEAAEKMKFYTLTTLR